MKKILIVGQGIAGTMLAWALHCRHAQVRMVDVSLPGASSKAAAGLVNPVTGRRFTKSWRVDELLPAAKAAYRDLEKTLNIPIWHELPILRLLRTAEEANDWAIRCRRSDYEPYLAELPDAGPWTGFLKPGYRVGLTRQAARVDFTRLMPAFRKWAMREGILQEKQFGYAEAERQAAEYDHIIFCEGWSSADNPFFSGLPWRHAKGEALLLRFPHTSEAEGISSAVKGSIMLAPVAPGLFWAGASYQWHFENALPTAAEKERMLGNLREMLSQDFEIVDHVAGIRPTVVDRRPLIGLSASDPRFGLFNGMGTKGALLAPFWAEHFTRHVLDGVSLDKEVDLRRSL